MKSIKLSLIAFSLMIVSGSFAQEQEVKSVDPEISKRKQSLVVIGNEKSATRKAESSKIQPADINKEEKLDSKKVVDSKQSSK